MNTEELDKIKRKLTKLLALSASPNESEAALAMEKCQQLMDKYNIRTIDIDPVEMTLDVNQEIVPGMNNRYSSWEATLASAIAACFDSTAIISKFPDGTWTIAFIAGKSDLEFCVNLFKRLRRIISKRSKLYIDIVNESYDNIKAKPPNSRSAKFSYCQGMITVIYDRLKLIYKNTENQQDTTTTSLVVVKENAIKDFTAAKYGEVKKKKPQININNAEAFKQGAVDGKTVPLHRDLYGPEPTEKIG